MSQNRITRTDKSSRIKTALEGGIRIRGPLTIITIATVTLVLVAYLVGGFPLVVEGLENSWSTLLQAVPLILAAFLVIGQLQELVSKELIDRLLQKFAGTKGIFFTILAGGFFPGPPYVFYPFLASFREKKIPFYLFFSFVVGKQVYDFARIPMEMSLISPGIALLRNAITVPLPLFMGLIARFFYRDMLTDEFFAKDEGKEKR